MHSYQKHQKASTIIICQNPKSNKKEKNIPKNKTSALLCQKHTCDQIISPAKKARVCSISFSALRLAIVIKSPDICNQ